MTFVGISKLVSGFGEEISAHCSLQLGSPFFGSERTLCRLLSCSSWVNCILGAIFFFYNRAKQRYLQRKDDQLHPVQHLISATEAEVSLFTNPIWLVKTRLQLQTPKHHTSGYSGFSAFIL